MMPEEDKKVTIGLLIVAGLGGLAGVLALYALAQAAPAVFTCPYCGDEFATEEELLAHIELVHPGMPPPDGVTQFTYVSDFVRNYLNAADFMTIEVQNVGEVAAVCTLNLSTKYKVWSACPSIPEWVDRGSISLLIEPGEVVTFGEGQEWIITFPVTGDEWQGCEIRGITLRLVGDAGVYEKYYKHFA